MWWAILWWRWKRSRSNHRPPHRHRSHRMNPSIVARQWRLLFSDASRSTLELSTIDAFICYKWYAYPSSRFWRSLFKILWCSWSRLTRMREHVMWINRLVHKTQIDVDILTIRWYLDIGCYFIPDFSYGKQIFWAQSKVFNLRSLRLSTG